MEEPQLTDGLLDKGLRAAIRLRRSIATGTGTAGRSSIASASHALEVAREDVAPASIGRYRVAGEVGRGGMALVLSVRDDALERDLAVKVLRERHGADDELVRHFLAEARIAARLQHPGVVPVHEIGTTAEGRPYFTMRLVEGRTLSEMLAGDDGSAAFRERLLGIFERICETVAYAHSCGIVHRDLKPSNVMAGRFGEVLVMDWGFAKSVARPADEAADAGATGPAGPRITGTPAYMPPEQATGRARDAQPASDVFALGAILCEMLTGKPAYDSETPHEALLAAAKGWIDAAWERLDASSADRELIVLAKRCLDPDPAKRPRDASEVAAAVAGYRASVAERARVAEIRAAEDRAAAAQERRVRRRTALALGSGILLLAAVAAGAFWMQHQRAERLRENGRLVGDALERAGHFRGAASADPAGATAALGQAALILDEARAVATRAGVDPPLLGRLDAAIAEVDERRRTATRDAACAERIMEIREHLGDERDARGRIADYAAIFRELGCDPAAAEVATTAERIRTSPISEALLLALDDWARAARRGGDAETAHRLVALACAADPDSFRQEVREAGLAGDVPRLRTIAASVEGGEQPAESLRLLAENLSSAREAEWALRIYRLAQVRHPGDFWINHDLGSILRGDRKNAAEAARLFWMALAARPRSAHVRADVVHALIVGGDLAGARRAADELVRAHPAYAPGHHYLGVIALDAGQIEEALARTAEALALDSGFAESHVIRGLVRLRQEETDEALMEFEAAVQLNPASASTLAPLGETLLRSGRSDRALPVLERCAVADPGNAVVHYLLGKAALAEGSDERTLSAYARAVELDPALPEAQVDLGLLLLRHGRFEDAVRHLRAGEAAGRTRDMDWGAPLERLVADAETALATSRTLDALEDEGELPQEPREAARVGRIAVASGRPRLGLTLLRHAFEDLPVLKAQGTPSSRYLAACAAAGLASAKTTDEAGAERAALEAEALAGLEAELDAVDVDPDASADGRSLARTMLLRWAHEPALAPFRSGAAPSTCALPPRWAELWEARARILAELAPR